MPRRAKYSGSRRKLRDIEPVNYCEKSGDFGTIKGASPARKRAKVSRRQRKKIKEETQKEVESRDWSQLITEMDMLNGIKADSKSTKNDSSNENIENKEKEKSIGNADLSQLKSSVIKDAESLNLEEIGNKYFDNDKNGDLKIDLKEEIESSEQANILSKSLNNGTINNGTINNFIVSENKVSNKGDASDDTSDGGNESEEQDNDISEEQDIDVSSKRDPTPPRRRRDNNNNNGNVGRNKSKKSKKGRKPTAKWGPIHTAALTIIMKKIAQTGKVGSIKIENSFLHCQWQAIYRIFIRHTQADENVFTLTVVKNKWNSAVCASGKERCPALHQSWGPIKAEMDAKFAENAIDSNNQSLERMLNRQKEKIKEKRAKKVDKDNNNTAGDISTQMGNCLSLFSQYLAFQTRQTQSININSNNNIGTMANNTGAPAVLTSIVDQSGSK